ncbi:MAG: hypothetical protein IJK36_07780 [Bacteroidales bacterium]|nr:hypothetical protein [Bacteroidales bacterium]
MRKTIALLLLLAVICSCSTDVDLYTDFKDTTIVYGILDVANDTNVIKIIRAFSGSNDDSFDANQIALIADSSNYPGKLDARFVEYKKASGSTFLPTGREVILDTMTIHDKEEGMFYAPDQKLYYTTEHFNVNNANEKFKYKLLIYKPNDTVSSEISLIGGTSFQITAPMVFFRAENAGKRELRFTPDDNDAVYQVTMQFNYKELKPGQDTVYKNVNWSMGPYSTYELGIEGGELYFTYREDVLFELLSAAIGGDILNVERFYDNFVVSMYAYGKELDEYIQINTDASGIDYYYTNIHGGVGILSSCHTIQKYVDISSRTKIDLLSMPWGFKNVGYKE